VHIHLDAIGGIAGDMFVAAMIDARPEHEHDVAAALSRLPGLAGVTADLAEINDGILTGRRFVVERDHRHDPGDPDAHPSHDHASHDHTTFSDIRQMLSSSMLAEPVRDHAIAIFALLAEAEGTVHGRRPEDVTFHEVGAWDSIVDIVSAAVLIDLCGDATWSVSPLPLGSGRIDTAHGVLPIPAPATTLLLEGFPVIDDGVGGERVTPTGAAIVRHLDPAHAPPSTPMAITHSGHGFGTMNLPGMSNVLRVLVFEPAGQSDRNLVAVIRFEVDDQNPEDLAVGLEHLRDRDDVLDVTQAPVLGKKGRMASHVQVLAEPGSLDPVIEACFGETTTIGVRFAHESRVVLERRVDRRDALGVSVGVKTVLRPGGPDVKAEMDDIAEAGDREARDRRRGRAESADPPRHRHG